MKVNPAPNTNFERSSAQKTIGSLTLFALICIERGPHFIALHT